jgi:hypothetical protein
MDRHAVTRAIEDEGFPKSVARVTGRRAWLLADILAYREGEVIPERVEGEGQHLVLGSGDVAKMLDIQSTSVRWAARQGKATAPPADGHMGNAPYWLRESVDAWLRENPDRMPRRRVVPRFRREGEKAVLARDHCAPAPEGSDRRGIDGHSSGHAHVHEPHLVDVGQWLATDPPQETASAYDAYAREHNDKVASGEIEGHALVLASAISLSLSLSWPDILRAARQEADVAHLQACRQERPLGSDKGPLGLIGPSALSVVLGMSIRQAHRSQAA